MGKNDKFAQIAAMAAICRDEALYTPHIRKPEDRALPLAQGESRYDMTGSESPQASLARELQALREKYRPFFAACAPQIAQTRQILPLTSFDWRVLTPADAADFSAVLAGCGSWERVTIPHYGAPLGKAETVYRTVFCAPDVSAARQSAFLCFDGVDYAADVYLNGKCVGSHEGFFAPFELDCTESLRSGENTLAICVKNDFVHMGSALFYGGPEYSGDKLYAATGPGYDEPETGWHHCPPGMGIYQPVRLELRARQFIQSIFVRPLPDEHRIRLTLEAFSTQTEPLAVSFRLGLYGENFPQTLLEGHSFTPSTYHEIPLGDTVKEAEMREQGLLGVPVPLRLEKGVNYYTTELPMEAFRLWTPDTPWLYALHAELLSPDGSAIDAQRAVFGMRSFKMDTASEPRGRLYLNGEPIRLRGANTMGFEQQDVMRGDDAQLFEDLLLAKACHLNFLRLTQRPVQQKVYDFCDRLGLMAQTDLPLFGVLRRNKFCEAVRQAEEMERLVRNHPCSILLSYINEPAPNARNCPHRHLEREQLRAFFACADHAVHLQNPDRVVKHVEGDFDPPTSPDTLTDNHCYNYWYNGQGLDAGCLRAGDWLQVKKGWLYACGEYGAEGLDPVGLMRRRYPAAWLPQTAQDEAVWTPDRIPAAQSGSLHYCFYETPHTLDEWAARSQAHQAEAARQMTQAFRRNADMISFAIHLLIDAFPSGWMKAIVDCERTPKPAYFAYRDALTPVMVSIRTDRECYFPGEQTDLELWACNDTPHAVPAKLVYELLTPDGVRQSGVLALDIPACMPVYAGSVHALLPQAAGRGVLRTLLLDENGTVLHRAASEFDVMPREALLGDTRLCVLDTASPAQAAQADTLIAASYDAYARSAEALDALVRGGKKLVFLRLPCGEHEICGQRVFVKACAMAPVHFCSRDTGHRWVRGFDSRSFRSWYSPEAQRITPLAGSTFTAADYAPVLLSGNTDEAGQWGPALIAGERKLGRGSVVICQLDLRQHAAANPAAWNFAQRMLRAEPEA